MWLVVKNAGVKAERMVRANGDIEAYFSKEQILF